MVAVSVGPGVGVNAVASRMIGAKRYEDASKTAASRFVLSLISTAVFILFGIFLVPAYVRTCSGSENTLAMCESYLRICTIFCLGIFMETLGQRLLQAVGNTTLSMVSLIAGAVTNIIFDLGIEGAAIAAVISQWGRNCGAGAECCYKPRDKVRIQRFPSGQRNCLANLQSRSVHYSDPSDGSHYAVFHERYPGCDAVWTGI